MIKGTYLAKYKNTRNNVDIRQRFPDAHFVVITHTSHSALAPSKELLGLYKNMIARVQEQLEELYDKKKYETAQNYIFDQVYVPKYITEINNSPAAQLMIQELITLALEGDVYVVCYEKDPRRCHRSIIMDIVNEEIKAQRDEFDDTMNFCMENNKEMFKKLAEL